VVLIVEILVISPPHKKQKDCSALYITYGLDYLCLFYLFCIYSEITLELCTGLTYKKKYSEITRLFLLLHCSMILLFLYVLHYEVLK